MTTQRDFMTTEEMGHALDGFFERIQGELFDPLNKRMETLFDPLNERMETLETDVKDIKADMSFLVAWVKKQDPTFNP